MFVVESRGGRTSNKTNNAHNRSNDNERNKIPRSSENSIQRSNILDMLPAIRCINSDIQKPLRKMENRKYLYLSYADMIFAKYCFVVIKEGVRGSCCVIHRYRS